jgi:hypothetical protein
MSAERHRTMRVVHSAARVPPGWAGLKLIRIILAGFVVLALLMGASSEAAEQLQSDRPWMNPGLDADSRVRLLLGAMTQDEKLTLVFGYFPSDAPWRNFKKPAEGPLVGDAAQHDSVMLTKIARRSALGARELPVE